MDLSDDQKRSSFDWDLVVIGSGSGGLAASKEAKRLKPELRVAVLDWVEPSHQGTTWGLGGTCVNVGCIPKKLFHYAGQFRKTVEDAKVFGWTTGSGAPLDIRNDWGKLTRTVNGSISNQNWTYKDSFKTAGIKYLNAKGSFLDEHTVLATTADGKSQKLTAERIIIAVGGRPRLPKDVPGWELGVTSDDIFWRAKKPLGKTLVQGAGYIALECAGFLHELGNDVSVIVRSTPLREFDQQAAHQIAESMERDGVRFIMPGTIDKLERKDEKSRIVATITEGKERRTEEFDTVMFAIGRDAIIGPLNLEKAKVKHTGKIIVDDLEATSQPHIYAIGDCAAKRPELTPVAIQAGLLLARRLYGGAKLLLSEAYIPTTVFTPLEYGAVGWSQEAAEQKFGADNVEAFALRCGTYETSCTEADEIKAPRSSHFTGKNLWARKYALAKGGEWADYEPDAYEEETRTRLYMKQRCLVKLVTLKSQGGKQHAVIGLHYVGPHAGEITQGFALALKAGVTKADFEGLVGIHPTVAEEFTSELISLAKGADFMKKRGCCG